MESVLYYETYIFFHPYFGTLVEPTEIPYTVEVARLTVDTDPENPMYITNFANYQLEDLS